MRLTELHRANQSALKPGECVKNSAFGSTFIVAGTALGAGMLAMPLATAGIGFATAMLLLFGLWIIMSYTALLLVEAYQHNDADMDLALWPINIWVILGAGLSALRCRFYFIR